MSKICLKILIKIKKTLRCDVSDLMIKMYRESGYTIGEHCRIFSELGAAEPYLVVIGNNVTISTDVKFLTHDNSIIKASKGKYSDLFGKITIGNNAFIGSGAILLPGVSISDDSIVAAGSIVTKSVTKKSKIIAGNPAKIIGDVETFLKKSEDAAFNMKGKSRAERKQTILKNEKKLLKRAEMQERSK